MKLTCSLLGIFCFFLTNTFAQTSFPQGVASGDPTADGVVIWTRALATSPETQVNWWIASDTLGTHRLQSGGMIATQEENYCIKIILTGLPAGSTFFYGFEAGGVQSPIGRTRTAALETSDHVRFAVVSCNHYEHGYFMAYRHIAETPDLQAVIHLGDYIYEYGNGDDAVRKADPPHEAITLDDYRRRYACYRSDPDLQEAHRLHPFILVWDDHEISNNSSTAGADNHQPETEGTWAERVAAGRQAYDEWMPMRISAKTPIHRSFRFDGLMTLFMLDTRLEGRDQQIYDVNNEAVYDSARTILGSEQREWLLSGLHTADTRWRVLGNQVMFSPLEASHLNPRLESMLLDGWDGYPADRYRLTQAMAEDPMKNFIFLTGDFHSSFVFDVPEDDWNHPMNRAKTSTYDPKTGKGAVAVEFLTPSVTSHNIDEYLKSGLGGTPKFLTPLVINVGSKRLQKESHNQKGSSEKEIINPHLRYLDLTSHGYVLMELQPDDAYFTFFLTKNPSNPKATLKAARKFVVHRGTPHAVEVNPFR